MVRVFGECINGLKHAEQFQHYLYLSFSSFVVGIGRAPLKYCLDNLHNFTIR